MRFPQKHHAAVRRPTDLPGNYWHWEWKLAAEGFLPITSVKSGFTEFGPSVYQVSNSEKGIHGFSQDLILCRCLRNFSIADADHEGLKLKGAVNSRSSLKLTVERQNLRSAL